MSTQDDFDDDAPVGHVLTRREVFALLAGAGAALVVGAGSAAAAPVRLLSGLGRPAAAPDAAANGLVPAAAAPQVTATPLPACIVRPAQTEGPYFVDERLNRSDIRTDPGTGQIREGVLLGLNFVVSAVGATYCVPLPNVMVDVWQCDGLGNYSDVGSFVGQKFLRGYQMTDANGMAGFTTIYPGWYPGRTVHIHFKIRTDPGSPNGTEFTSQLYFDDALTDVVFATRLPYSTRGPRSTRNNQDAIYANGGSQLLLTLTDDGNGGYVTTFTLGLTGVSATPVATAIATSTAVATTTPTATRTPAATNTPAPTNTPAATSTPGTCRANFSDVSLDDYFYEPVNYLYCMGAISGYADGTFRPYNNTTRAQLLKMIVLSQGWPIVSPATPTFSDVPTSHPFYPYVETAVARGIVAGYADGTFRPNNDVTRGQVCKIVVLAEGWPLINPAVPRFTDVPASHPFYRYIETAADRGVVSGYSNGTFQAERSATRGQIAKIVYMALTR